MTEGAFVPGFFSDKPISVSQLTLSTVEKGKPVDVNFEKHVSHECRDLQGSREEQKLASVPLPESLDGLGQFIANHLEFWIVIEVVQTHRLAPVVVHIFDYKESTCNCLFEVI